MGLLFVLLMILDDAESLVEPSAQWLLKHLPLFFIPGGAGLVLLGDHIKQDAPAIITAIIVSTLLSVLVTAWLYAKLTQRTTNTNHVTNDQS
jgi:holin-like protein